MKPYEGALQKVRYGESLSRQEVKESLLALYRDHDQTNASMQMGMLLYGTAVRGTQVDEILGLADFLCDVEPHLLGKLSVGETRVPIISVAGSGKKGVKTFNISSAACMVAAAAGCIIAKPISRATSSLTGSSDILSACGANIHIPTQRMADIMLKVGFGGFSIEGLIPGFDAFYGGKFLTSHSFSYVLPALINPIRADRLVYGLSDSKIILSAEAFQKLGLYKSGIILNSHARNVHVDELLPIGTSQIVAFDAQRIFPYSPGEVSELLSQIPYAIEHISPASDVNSQKEAFLRDLAGKGNETRQRIIALNAATIVAQTYPEMRLTDCANTCLEIIRSGAAYYKLMSFIKETVA